MRKMILALAAFALAGPAAAQTSDVTRLRQAGAEVLFWSQEQRDANFPAMEKGFPTRVVKAGGTVKPLPDGTPLGVPAAEIDAFVQAQNVAGMIVIKDGKVRLERYARGLTRNGRWTSFSVAKSFTSTLVGAALKDGAIKSLKDPLTNYIPELKGSGYDGVTVDQLLTMTSGVAWNEDYTDPNSDVARFIMVQPRPGEDPTVAYMRKLSRAHPPGTKWNYSTGETNLVGVLVSRATKKTLADYLSEKIWKPYGMEQDAVWMIDPSGHEVGGCCLSVSLRDYARIGLLSLEGGQGVVPADWFAEATRSHAEVRPGGFGYGYQWWTFPMGAYGAQGIFGQTILVHPPTKTVVVMLSAWPKATDQALGQARLAFLMKLVATASQ
jgi:CubicO group peptidase (beta-lactamase class C family)